MPEDYEVKWREMLAAERQRAEAANARANGAETLLSNQRVEIDQLRVQLAEAQAGAAAMRLRTERLIDWLAGLQTQVHFGGRLWCAVQGGIDAESEALNNTTAGRALAERVARLEEVLEAARESIRETRSTRRLRAAVDALGKPAPTT